MKKYAVNQSLLLLIFFGALILLTFYLLFSPSEKHQEIYTVENPQTRDVSKEIFASGSVQAKDQVKVGSLIAGVVKELTIEENQAVTEGQLLAVIDTGRGDTDVKQAEGAYEARLAELDFTEKEFRRKKELYKEKYVSDSEVQDAERAFDVSIGNIFAAQATLDRTRMEYHNNNIYAPASGIVTSIGVAKGERITTDLNASVIAEIAPDIVKMVAKLSIEERDIAHVKPGQNVHVFVDAYPDKSFDSEIFNVSFSPKKSDVGTYTYPAKAYLDNPQELLHPGMNVTAIIDVASARSALSISSRPMLLKPANIAKAAQILEYSLKPINPLEKKKLLEGPNKNIRFIWLVKDKSFEEIPIEIGVNNDIFFEVKSGLKASDRVLAGLQEEDEMNKLYQKLFRKGL